MRFPNADLVFARDTLVTIIRAVAIKRAIEASKPHPTATFWHVVNGGLFDTAIVDWCILFGSDNREQQRLHWKNMFDADEFRVGLLAALGMSREAFADYREVLKTYRDENAAHRDLDPKTETYPNMDVALECCFFYFERLAAPFAEAYPARDNPDLRLEYERNLAAFSRIAEVAVAATRDSNLLGG